jgi:hypothetical protein
MDPSRPARVRPPPPYAIDFQVVTSRRRAAGLVHFDGTAAAGMVWSWKPPGRPTLRPSMKATLMVTGVRRPCSYACAMAADCAACGARPRPVPVSHIHRRGEMAVAVYLDDDDCNTKGSLSLDVCCCSYDTRDEGGCIGWCLAPPPDAQAKYVVNCSQFTPDPVEDPADDPAGDPAEDGDDDGTGVEFGWGGHSRAFMDLLNECKSK